MSKPEVKSAPNSKESEMMVLGCMLTSVNSLNIASDYLDEKDFYYTEHQTVFKVLKTLYKTDKPADIHIVSEELKRVERLDDIGGISYLTTLAQYAGTSAYIEEYSQLVRDKAVLRKMIQTAQGMEKTALQEPDDVNTVLDEAQAQLFAISQASNVESGVLLKEIISGVKAESGLPYLKSLQEKQELYQEKGEKALSSMGLPTHFSDLDKMIHGFSPSNLMIIAGRPGMGKTAISLNFAENICFRDKVPVGLFSLEMSAEQLLHRMISSQAEVESDKIISGSLNGTEYQQVVACVNMMQKNTMIIDDQPGIKITDLRARARRMKEIYDIGFLVIDYLQLLSGSGNLRSTENRQMEITEISRMLKNLARELDIPILCGSQLSRKVEERQGHRPMMSDLRESGCLSGDTVIQDADSGKYYTMKELASREKQTPINVFAIDDDLKLGKHKMIKVFYSGKKKVFELKTKSGRSIKASANHPFRVFNQWKRLDELKVGERIALPRELSISKKQSIDKEEVKFLAHLLGDGCLLPNQPYHYTSADEENIQTVGTAANQLFNIHPRLVKQKNWYHLYLPSPVHLTHKKFHPITEWYNRLGLKRVRSYEKIIPEKIFQRSKKNRALFLNHLWSTDGNISSKTLKGRKPSANIYYASSSKTLSQQVQNLLLSIGIQSTLRKQDYKKKYRPMYHVYIQGVPNQRKFLNEVGCNGGRGKMIPLLLNQLNKIETNPNTDIISKKVWKTLVKEAKEKNNIGWREVCKKLDLAYCGSPLFKSGVSRARMSKLYEALHSPKLKVLAESDVYWDEIISMEEKETEDVYDATVENVLNFVANDIIVHNSLEQDCDIIMFLLRREYYDPYDKPGLAELIIGKNRHGATGSVNLSFRKEIGQFANYTPMEAQSDPGNEDAFSDFSPN